MTFAALLVLLHGDDPQMDLVYFWAGVLLALTPVVIFGTIGVLVVREMVHRSRAARDDGTAADGTAGDVMGPR